MTSAVRFVLCAALAWPAAWGQGLPAAQDVKRVPMPSTQELQKAMDAERARIGSAGKASLETATRRAHQRLDPGAVAEGMPRTTMPEVRPFIKGESVDPAKIASQYSELRAQGAEDQTYNVMVFVSLSMPEETLKRIGREVRKVGGVMVLRGLKNGLQPGSWAASLAALKPLAETGAQVQINPAMFLEFGVKAVPTTVVSADPIGDKGCASGACARHVASVVGDVSLAYALNILVDRRDSVGKVAREKLELLE